MRTTELASRAGINAETLRYYERRGLLQEPPRSPGGYRDYPVGAGGLLRFIKRAQELGFTLDEVKELVHLEAGGPDNCAAARALAEHPHGRPGAADWRPATDARLAGRPRRHL